MRLIEMPYLLKWVNPLLYIHDAIGVNMRFRYICMGMYSAKLL